MLFMFIETCNYKKNRSDATKTEILKRNTKNIEDDYLWFLEHPYMYVSVIRSSPFGQKRLLIYVNKKMRSLGHISQIALTALL